jgi:hypothetical protein
MPNMVLAAGGRGIPAALEFSRELRFGNRLDQTAAIADLARDAEHASIDPDDGLRRLDEIHSIPHRFGVAGVIGGHMVLTIGLCLILQPTPEALGMAAGFGALIGALKIYPTHWTTVGVLLPVVAATLVSALAFGLQPDKTIDGSMRVLIPALGIGAFLHSPGPGTRSAGYSWCCSPPTSASSSGPSCSPNHSAGSAAA